MGNKQGHAEHSLEEPPCQLPCADSGASVQSLPDSDGAPYDPPRGISTTLKSHFGDGGDAWPQPNVETRSFFQQQQPNDPIAQQLSVDIDVAAMTLNGDPSTPIAEQLMDDLHKVSMLSEEEASKPFPAQAWP